MTNISRQKGFISFRGYWVLFENSSHMPHLEETERFMQVVGEFLSRVELSANH